MSKYAACRVFDIKEELALTVGGTSKLVDRIEAAGLCRRRANPDDRRSQIIELTPAGRRLLEEAIETFEDELQTRLGSVLTGRSLDQSAGMLMQLRAANRPVTSRDEISPASAEAMPATGNRRPGPPESFRFGTAGPAGPGASRTVARIMSLIRWCRPVRGLRHRCHCAARIGARSQGWRRLKSTAAIITVPNWLRSSSSNTAVARVNAGFPRGVSPNVGPAG